MPIRCGGLFGLLLLAFLAPLGHGQAQQSGINVSGDFAYYVLALSWSPSYCAAEGSSADRRQCGTGRPYAFIVHGLWPQYERGWPEFCPHAPPRAPRAIVRDMLDLMPSESLIEHQWRKHGTCSGLTPQGYFETTRRARQRVSIPARFSRLAESITVSPGAVEQAFVEANPGLAADSIAVTCDRQRLREVRICLDRYSLDFRACPAVADRGCARERVGMPPVRGR